MKKFNKFFISLPLILTLSSCFKPQIFESNVQKRGFFSDTLLRIALQKILLKEKAWSRCKVLVFQGRVLVVGALKDESKKKTILEKINTLDGVKKVFNHLEIDDYSTEESGRDQLLTRKIKLALFSRPQLLFQNYQLIVFKRIVYILGIIRKDPEKPLLLRCIENFNVRNIQDYLEFYTPPSKEKNNA